MPLRILLLFAFVSSLACGSSATRPPNVVVVIVDDLRADALGCTGSTVARAPNIDRLAREGLSLRKAFVTTSLCSPSRATFLTGLYAHSHRIWGNEKPNEVRDDTLATFPQLLQKAGYETALIGKWHMDAHARPRPGFDDWISFRGQGTYVDPQLNINGTEQQRTGYLTDLLHEEAEKWLQGRKKKPFFLWFSHKAVHEPAVPAPRHTGLYPDLVLPTPPIDAGDLEGKPALRGKVAAAPKNNDGKAKAESKMPRQLRTLAAVDEGVGRLRAALEAKGELDRTLFIFTSDNGYFWGEHGLTDKRAAYEESIRIPWIMRWPAEIKAGTTSDAMVLNVDLASTLLELAQVDNPPKLHGRSLRPLWREIAAPAWRESALFEYRQEERFPRIRTFQAVRTARWKYITYPDLADADELYDLEADPRETRNLIAEPSLGETRAGLLSELRRLCAASDAPLR